MSAAWLNSHARILGLVLAVACSVWPPAAQSTQVFVTRRGWHVDVGFAVEDLQPPLRSIAGELPAAHYIFFGFGDKHYLMSKHHGTSSLAAALWPGDGIMLVTGLRNRPGEDFDQRNLATLELSSQQSDLLQNSVWQSFQRQGNVAHVYQNGMNEESLYYLSVERYSAKHTCNTWVAESLRRAGLRVRSTGTVFAGQLWSQVKRLENARPSAPSVAPMSN